MSRIGTLREAVRHLHLSDSVGCDFLVEICLFMFEAVSMTFPLKNRHRMMREKRTGKMMEK